MQALREMVEGLSEFVPGGITVELPGGTRVGAGSCRVVIKDDRVLRDILRDPEMGFGEHYMKGNLAVEGDLESFLRGCFLYLQRKKEEKNLGFDLMRALLRMLGLIRRWEEREVRKHYDLGNEFYSLWLDSSMTYSCAFFASPGMTLEHAQQEKRRIIYEKLQLTEGDTLLDIGCGWGSIITEVATLYPIRAVGITLSKNQYQYVKEKILQEGLEGRVEVYLMHYEELPKLGRKFNKVVSVGMFEHVGKGRHRKFFQVVSDILEEGGLFLLHTIGKVHPSSQSRWIRKYIFPGGYIPSIEEILRACEGLGFNLIDIDDWRIHYYRTLKEWRKRFHQNKDHVISLYGEEFFRMWDLYLTASAVSFYVGSNHLFQFLFSKGVINSYPVMRRVFLQSPVASHSV
ncbi:Cyclopropane-fatty-acyl-phospholipid synthase [Thermocrinis albus DSM 14484]|uniref:Cyclopropane-fatty-acyl-phospholipid synthase n=1 Tax=Thermocrinis albus (strain DSM 14484 / JCM 11386 / HI 11/12) TaxID=638303 RepID=D3SQA1_THEAH|nr:class I SAM-dependent methyltransferase [Thermocrinis albus]ADC89338.1 Cyclopropane-fatty-acyl-phospholipid synthase [Thermocrinis albus DSM 14484]